MKKLKILLLLSWFFLSSFASLPQAANKETPPLRPEDYLPTPQDLPQEFLDKFQGEEFKIADPRQMKLPNLYRAVHELRAGGMNIRCEVYVGVEGYWEGLPLTFSFGTIKTGTPEGNWDYAVQMEGSREIVRFVKGNVLAEVYQNGGQIEDGLLVARILADKLPETLPNPDTWDLIVPEYDEKAAQLPSKYLFEIINRSGGNILRSKPDNMMMLVTRYPFTQFTKAIWDYQLGEYVHVSQHENLDPIWLLNEHHLGVFTTDWEAFYPPLIYGSYEVRYWVNGETAGVYPFWIRD